MPCHLESFPRMSVGTVMTSITKSMVTSIDDLEKKVGVDFFVNLPKDVQDKVEAENPADFAWWWNN